MKIKKIKKNKEGDLGIGFDDTFKADNNISFIASWANGMIDWMVRNFISRVQILF